MQPVRVYRQNGYPGIIGLSNHMKLLRLKKWHIKP